MELKWSYALLIMVLLGCGSSLDWMGAGNWTSDNLTILHNQINTVTPLEQTSSLTASAKSISDELNTLWDPAWNVVIVYYADGNNYDSVLYGYGFNGHWFWLNGYLISPGYVAFIIWKDYNCVSWVNFESDYSYTTYSSLITSALSSLFTGGYVNLQLSDIWTVAMNVQNQVTIP